MSEMTPELFTELIEASWKFGDAYHEAAEAKKTGEEAKEAFYEVIDRALSRRRLAQKTIQVKDEEVAQHVATYHPGWRPVSSEPLETGYISVIIEQDPAQMKFSFTNLEDGHHYQRTYQEGNPQLDEERLRAEDPDLWEAITVWPEAPSWLTHFMRHIYRVDVLPSDVQGDWETFLDGGDHTIDRVLKPPSEWTKEQKAALQPYLVPGMRTMKVVKPRKATEEEIQEAIDLLDELSSEAGVE